jgi:hypothetical protein
MSRHCTCRWKRRDVTCPVPSLLETPIDSGIDLSIRIDNLGVFINKKLSTDSLINQLLIKRDYLSISIDSRSVDLFQVEFGVLV